MTNRLNMTRPRTITLVAALALAGAMAIGVFRSTPAVAQPKQDDKPRQVDEKRDPRGDRHEGRDDRDDDDHSRRDGRYSGRFSGRPSMTPRGDRPFPEPFKTKEEAYEQGVRMFRLMQGDDSSDKFDQALKENPQRIHQFVERAWPRLQVMIEQEKTDPKTFALRLEDMRHVRQAMRIYFGLREARKNNDEAKINELRDQLRDVYTKRFETRMKIREQELANLEDRIKTLKDELAQMSKNKDALIDQQMQRAMRPPGPRDRHRDGDKSRDDERDDEK